MLQNSYIECRIFIRNHYLRYVDGTFKCVPALFTQMYTIHGINDSKILPLLYILLPNKKESTYSIVFNALKKLSPILCPESIMMDYEKAVMNVCMKQYPSVKIRGCFFHFKQAIYRKVGQLGLKKKYDTDSKFSAQIRHLAALAYVPEYDVVTVFEEIIEKNIIPSDAEGLLDYFEDVWIGRPGRNQTRRAPTFPISMWNMYSNVQLDLPRTNNCVEGWHTSFNSLLSCSHPTIWKFLNILKAEQSRNEMMFEKIIAGEEGLPQKKKYKNHTDQLIKVITNYKKIDNMTYLKGIAYNFNL